MLLGDPAAADVLQETNLDLWARAEDYDFDRPFLPWAFGFARQKVLVFRRTHCRSRLIFGDEALNRIHETCMKYASDADDRLIALRKCLQKLNPQQAETFVHGATRRRLQVKLLATRWNDTVQNISSRLHRIRKQLGKCINATLATMER